MAARSAILPEVNGNSNNRSDDSFSRSDKIDEQLEDEDLSKDKVTYMDKLNISKSPLYFMKVIKVYWLWFLLIVVNIFVFLIMPMVGNYNLHRSIYCNISDLN